MFFRALFPTAMKQEKEDRRAPFFEVKGNEVQNEHKVISIILLMK